MISLRQGGTFLEASCAQISQEFGLLSGRVAGGMLPFFLEFTRECAAGKFSFMIFRKYLRGSFFFVPFFYSDPATIRLLHADRHEIHILSNG